MKPYTACILLGAAAASGWWAIIAVPLVNPVGAVVVGATLLLSAGAILCIVFESCD